MPGIRPPARPPRARATAADLVGVRLQAQVSSFRVPNPLTSLIRRAIPRSVRNSLRHPATSARSLYDDARFGAGFVTTLSMRSDWTVRCHPAAADAFRFQRDEPDPAIELRDFITRCSSGMTLIDVGAHFGVFTLAALHYSGGSARVVAVDPSPRAGRVLTANVALASATTQVQIERLALASEVGVVSLLSTGAGAYHMMIPTAWRPDASTVSSTTLDALATRCQVRPTHLKIDVEGSEGDVLEGGRRVLETCRPVIFLELHGWMIRAAGRDPSGVLLFLRNHGYSRIERAGSPITAAAAAALDMARLVCLPDMPATPDPAVPQGPFTRGAATG